MDLDFEIMFFEKHSDSYKQYEENILRFIARVLVLNEEAVELQEKKEDSLYRGELASNIFRLVGKVRGCDVHKDNNKLLTLIKQYCRRDELENTLIAFSSAVFNDFLLLRPTLRSRANRKLHSLHFGTLINLKDFVPHVQIANKAAGIEEPNFGDACVDEMHALFEHYSKKLRINLKVNNENHFQFVVEYSSINYIVISMFETFWTIYLVMANPPQLFEVKKGVVRNGRRITFVQNDEGFVDYDENDFNKEENEVLFTNRNIYLRQPTIMKSIKPVIFTKSNVIQLRPPQYKNIDEYDYWRQTWAIVSNINRYSNTPVYIGKIKQMCDSLGDLTLPQPKNLPFNVHYAFQSLDNVSYQLHDELHFHSKSQNSNLSAFDEFVEKVECLSRKNAKATEEALYDLFWLKDQSIPIDCFLALEKRFEEKQKLGSLLMKPSNLVDVRRCIFTPTRTILLPPLPYQQSRFLRTYEPDFALRVYAKDDNLKSLNYSFMYETEEHCRDFLNQYLLHKFILGIKIKDRDYQYLASSTSQLRDIGMTYYATDSNGIDAETVRQEIGDVEHIKNPGKVICRIGQHFSQPIAFIKHIDTKCVTVEDDITGGYNYKSCKPYVFSDGVGMISYDLAVELTKAVDEDREHPFSAFQIRHAGAKGMVTLNPCLKGTRMIIRKSMMKFKSPATSIDIIKVSEPRYVHLNRPFINILEQLGVDSGVFMTQAREQFQKIVESFNCKCKALEAIKMFSDLKLDYGSIRDCDIDVFGEMFFRKIQQAITEEVIKTIKSRARIKLPGSIARTMLGVLDETRILQEGQVFVQYSEFDDYKKKTVLRGEILVTKFPCMHPGDVRKFTAIDISQLRHICDCIVFPQQGSRPHPDMMAGSDLDGDEYAVIWDKSFIFSRQNYEPMNYPSGEDTILLNKVESGEMLEFYVDFIEKYNVGIIANSHLALSDQYPNGIFDDRCKKLAEQYAVSLDFAKSGQIDNQPADRPTFYPDFMEKCETRPTYKSQRALGKLYRFTSMFQENGEFEGFLGEKLNSNESLLTFPGWQQFEEDAENMYHTYRGKMLQIQGQFGIEDEVSLLGGVYSRVQKYVCSPNEKEDVAETIKFMVNNVVKELTNLFYSSVKDCDITEATRKQRAKASALYLVTKRMNENNANPYYGLPWIVSSVLCEVANFNSPETKHICFLNRELKADDHIPEFSASNVQNVLIHWLDNCLRIFRGFQQIPGNAHEKYLYVVQPFVAEDFRSTDRVDFCIQRILKQLSTQLKSGDEFENMLALAASMTLRRFRRTKKFECFTQQLGTKDTKKETWVTCLAYSHKEDNSIGVENFAKYFRWNGNNFNEKLKRSGVENICCHGFHRWLFVSAYGKVECLKKLRNALTNINFYKDIVNNSLQFD